MLTVIASLQVEFLLPLKKHIPAALGLDNSHILYRITSTATVCLQAWVEALLKDLPNLKWSIIIGKIKLRVSSNFISNKETGMWRLNGKSLSTGTSNSWFKFTWKSLHFYAHTLLTLPGESVTITANFSLQQHAPMDGKISSNHNHLLTNTGDVRAKLPAAPANQTFTFSLWPTF